VKPEDRLNSNPFSGPKREPAGMSGFQLTFARKI
jgi:hypothetical protein